MANNQKALTVDQVTIDRVLSHYLWNSPTAPSCVDMNNQINRSNNTDRDPITIDAVDYMKNGGGRFASAANFGMFEKFFDKSGLAAKEYTFEEMGNAIYGASEFAKLKTDTFYNPNEKTYLIRLNSPNTFFRQALP